MANSPSIFVTDSTIWIDAYRGGVITQVFDLPFQFITPDFIYEELKHSACPDLLSLGLVKRELSPELVSEVFETVQKYPRIAMIDISGLVLARHLEIPLLSGNDDLRKAAGTEAIKPHGTLFLLDKMVEHRVIPPPDAAQALNRMLACRGRMPEKECKKRLDAWGMPNGSPLRNDENGI